MNKVGTRSTTSVLATLTLTVAVLVSFQNCKELTPASGSRPSNSSSGLNNSGGEGYGGKTYLEIGRENCLDGQKHSAAIEFPGDGKAYIVRDACKELPVPTVVQVNSGSADDSAVLLKKRTFYKAGQFFSDPGFERGPQTDPMDPANTYSLSSPLNSPDGVLAEAARSGRFGLRISRSSLDTVGHLHFLKNRSRYRLSFWARLAETNSNPKPIVRLESYERGRWSSQPGSAFISDLINSASREISINDTEWKRYEFEFYVSGPAPYFTWQLRTFGAYNNPMDLDDFAIEEVSCNGPCTSDFPLSDIPWKELEGRTGTLLSFPEGNLDSSSAILKVLPYQYVPFPQSPPPPSAIVGAQLSSAAAYRGANGFAFGGHTVELELPARILQQLRNGHKYRVQFWARRVESHPSLPATHVLPPQFGYSSSAGGSGNSRAGISYWINIVDTEWKSYQIIMEPVSMPGFLWMKPSIKFVPLTDLLHIDEITIEEL